ncbi:Piwi domain-containing protein [Xylariales sp. AK1849]|nr:Piwi domain-containing protein [Xylariales sp. AK1849]
MNFDGASDRPGGASQRGSSVQGSQRSASGTQAGGSHARTASNVGSQQGSQHGSPARSRAGSNASGSQATGTGTGKSNPFGPSMGYDPARDPNAHPVLSDSELVGKRVDLPPDAFRTDGSGTIFTKRPGFNSEGKPIKVQVNIFAVKEVPQGDIYQYDASLFRLVNVSPNPKDSRALVRKIWESRPVQTWLRSTGSKWLFDGHKIAWSAKPIPRNEWRITVDLDAEAGKTPIGRDGVFKITIREATKIRMQYLKAYLSRQADWDNPVLECMNLLDHLMRQWPSETMQTIKRNFYPQSGAELHLDSLIAVRKGIYSAFKLSEASPGSISNGLTLNVDVANTAFWQRDQTFSRVAQYLCSPSGTRNIDGAMPIGRLADALRPVKYRHPTTGSETWIQSDAFKKLRRFQRLKFSVTHRGKAENPKVYTCKGIMFNTKYGAKGADALTVTFNKKNKDGTIDPPITIAQYFSKTYGGRIGYPDLPLVETTRDGLFPMEVCKLIRFQRYAYKLDPEQTSNMIKIAVSRPHQRKAEVMDGVRNLKWNEDPFFKEYGVKINPDMIISNARLLQNPEVHFGGGQKINPNVSGRWDLRGKKFIEPNTVPLTSWGFIGCGSNDKATLHKDELKAFASQFIRIYRGHGGIIKKDPFVECYPYTMTYPDMCSNGYNDTGKACGGPPQILFLVTTTRNLLVYERIKKNMDCRLCTVSQIMQADHVKKNNAQYCSNVAMKVNAKLGGATCKAVPMGAKPGFTYFQIPTMIIGLDVSHGSPGSGQPSMAAMTMSIDKTGTKYCANVQTNGWRVEIVTGVTMHFLFERMLRYWVRTNKCPPKHVYYFRDGVSEGQFAHVIDQEIKELKRMFRDANFDPPRFTVIVATKRHHIRFFPKPGDASSGDKNANPLPGTLVEHDATHPFHWDFYLASHVAIQGTARPVHYHVILDEAKCNPNDLQKMLYHQCYQYIRSTTPVSLHPAVYYSHLASVRAGGHQDVAASNREVPSGKAGFPLAKAPSSVYSGPRPTEAPFLIPMENKQAFQPNLQHINTTMWYI